jgi:CelD/BcsL family acetyltransferase involved in cellulose biosynthesis
MATLHVRCWSHEEFLAGRDAWRELLARSGADPLFMSWDWLACWWRHHQAPLQAGLRVLGVYSAGGELRGLAPLYLHRGRHRGVFRTRRLELLGSAWRDADAVFSEYLDLIADPGSRAGVCTAVRDWLRAHTEWDELVLCNLRAGSLAAQLASALAGDAYLRAVESMTGWSITLPDSFAAFVAGLSSNTRRKALHQRDKLADSDCLLVARGQRGAALARLEEFVARRWQRGSPAAARARFHADVVDQLGDEVVRLSELRAGATGISVMLNLRVAGTEYYLQSGFDADHARGISPGYLHMGHAIEAACRDGLRRFDLLAGPGLHRDYKRDFGAQATPLQSLQLVRKPLLRALFRVADGLRGSGQIV